MLAKNYIPDKENLSKLIHNIWFQEILLATLDLILKALFVILITLCRKKMNPYWFAILAIIVQFAILSLIVRGTYLVSEKKHSDRKNGKLLNLTPEQQLKYSTMAIVSFQSISIILGIVAPLLYEYDQIKLKTMAFLQLTAFVCGIIPISIFTAISITHSRKKKENKEEIKNNKVCKFIKSNIWFQEFCISGLDIFLKAVLMSTRTFFKEKIDPEVFAILLVLVEVIRSGLLIRGTYFTWENIYEKKEREKQNGLLIKSPKKELLYSVIAISILQLAYIIISIITPLLYEYNHISLKNGVIIGIIGFICAVIPNSILTTTSLVVLRRDEPPNEIQCENTTNLVRESSTIN